MKTNFSKPPSRHKQDHFLLCTIPSRKPAGPRFCRTSFLFRRITFFASHTQLTHTVLPTEDFTASGRPLAPLMYVNRTGAPRKLTVQARRRGDEEKEAQQEDEEAVIGTSLRCGGLGRVVELYEYRKKSLVKE